MPLLMGYWLYQAQFNNFVLLKDVVFKNDLTGVRLRKGVNYEMYSFRTLDNRPIYFIQ